jgi:hypothetical protein
MPQRQLTAHNRRRLTLALALGVVAIVAVAASGRVGRNATHGPLTLTATVAPWQLPDPVSAATAIPLGGKIYLAGGLSPSGGSTGAIVRIDPASGRSAPAGTLALAGHDAGAAVLSGQGVVFGGGTIASTAATQSFAPGGNATPAGTLPTARSDLGVAEVDGHAYIVGGYDGRRALPDVLSTADGRSFTTVAALAQPVRYPAVAAAGQYVYAFGGEDVGGTAVATIQRIDVARRSVQVVGRLPVATSHAAAVTLEGQIFVAGGRSRGGPTDAVWRFDPAHGTLSRAAPLPIAVSDAAVAAPTRDTAYLLGGRGAAPVATVVALHLGARAARPAKAGAWAPGQPPFPGRLLIADRGNDRLLLLDSNKRILWRYPSPSAPPPPGGFYFPDDAFFINHGTAIISNQEENHTIVEIGFPSGRILWQYGHPRDAGAAPGYLNQPDDAYLLKDGTITVADALNCRILFISPQGRQLSQIGTDGRCVHDPPTGVGYPNGDTPLANGDVLVSEINGRYITEYTRSGQLVWTRHLPEISYPSDPQQLGPDLYLVADYARPGGIFEFTREGQIVWSYRPSSGDGMLDHPSLAERLPNGLIGVNDDYRHRVALIDPASRRIVWQYGGTDAAGKAGGQLTIPDGFDLLVGTATPGHPSTG